MQRITVERLGSGVWARLLGPRTPPDVVQLRVWFDTDQDVAPAVAEILGTLSDTGSASLEFWDESKSVLDALGSLHLTPTRPGSAAHLALFDVPLPALAPILDRLSFASFGGWIGIGYDLLVRILTLERDEQRMRVMPAGGAMTVFSLYDRNLEIFARGFGEDVLRSKIQTAGQRVGVQVG